MSAGQDRLELFQTWPVETQDLRDPHMSDAHEFWVKTIEGAKKTIDLAHFYASNQEGSRLESVIETLIDAANRGVEVRFLADKGFTQTYPETLDRLAAIDGIDVLHYDVKSLMGGVLHAKYMIVDAQHVVVGSQNFDWRALEHILELGAHVDDAAIAGAYLDIFNTDWALAGGAEEDFRVQLDSKYSFPRKLKFDGITVEVTPVFSPRDWLVDDSLWDLPHLIAAIDGAKKRVRVQLLSYNVDARDGTRWPELDDAMRRAAARGAQVQLMVSHWNLRHYSLPSLKSLQEVDGIEVRFVQVPEWSGGFIPFGRVIHAKCMTVDGQLGWVGTSNWQRGYFFTSRNAGLIVKGEAFAEKLDGFFERTWKSDFAETIDPDREYEAPRVGE